MINSETFLKIAERVGVPVLILAAFLWVAREAGIAVQNTVVEPMVHGHVEFLEATKENLQEITHVQKNQVEMLREIKEAVIHERTKD